MLVAKKLLSLFLKPQTSAQVAELQLVVFFCKSSLVKREQEELTLLAGWPPGTTTRRSFGLLGLCTNRNLSTTKFCKL